MRANIWTTILIIFIMVLTFLNLVAVSGVLVGLVEGAGITYRHQYSGDVLITTKLEKNFIQDSVGTMSFIESLPGVESVTGRYVYNGVVEANYKNKIRPTDKTNSVGTGIVGIDPARENKTNSLRSLLVEGDYLSEDDYGKVLVGSMLLDQYLGFNTPTFPVLHGVKVGDKVRLVVGKNVREVTVKGIIKSKVDEVSRRVFLNDHELRAVSGRSDKNVNEISVRLAEGVSPELIKSQILRAGFGRDGNVMTWQESQGKFFDDIKNTMNMLGTGIGLIGILVASITIFIVIFINAVTRRKFIGILKGIGVSSLSIEVSYVLQSMFYAVLGTILGLSVVYLILVPYFIANPINFPFSDGIMVAPVGETVIRALLLFITTVIAGYVPARIIISKNTLDSILGR